LTMPIQFTSIHGGSAARNKMAKKKADADDMKSHNYKSTT